MKKLVVGLAVMLGFCMCAHQPSGTLDVNKALDYCAEQTQRTLAELKTDSGIDYTMMPRNIMQSKLYSVAGTTREQTFTVVTTIFRILGVLLLT